MTVGELLARPWDGICDRFWERRAEGALRRRAMVAIPEGHAVRCLDCRVVYDDRSGCPRCGSDKGAAIGRGGVR